MRYGRPLLDRVAEKIEPSETDCLLWTAARNGKGYGAITVDGATRLAHRVVYELVVGPIPEGLHSDHLCRTPTCVNPDHIEFVTPAENTRRGVSANGSKTHCLNGHPFDEENTYRSTRGRVCRTCMREHRRRYKRRHREAAVA